MNQEALDPNLMLHAYDHGIFPMAEAASDPELTWFEPDYRGIFPIDTFYLSRSTRRFLKKNEIKSTLNNEFDSVLYHCSNRNETWINQTLKDLYKELHSCRDATVSKSG